MFGLCDLADLATLRDLLLHQIYSRIALWITDLELHRTQTEYDESLALKTYLLQCINFYSSILYIAIFKGKFTGHPWEYNRLFGKRERD